MREIKFRAWDGEMMHKDVSLLSEWGAIKKGYAGSPWLDIAKAGTPMQFTGLHDKNRKEIYEGDILKWDEKKWGCPYLEVCKWDYELLNMRFNDWESYCEVIGNIYENPELMETTNGRP